MNTYILIPGQLIFYQYFKALEVITDIKFIRKISGGIIMIIPGRVMKLKLHRIWKN
jgi:hypothetical protein